MKIIRIILTCLIIVNVVSSQAIIVDSSFGINGRITYRNLEDVFGSNYHLNFDGNRNILVNSLNKFLYVDSTGNLLNIIPYSNPFSFASSNQVFNTRYVKITPKNDEYISYIQFNATFRYFVKKLNLDNLQDSSFGNKGELMIGKKDDFPLNYGQNSLGQLIVLQSIPNYPKNQNSIKVILFNDKGIVDSLILKLPNCNDTAQIHGSNVTSDSNGNIIFGYTDFCNDTLKTTLIRIKHDLTIDKLFAQNGYLPVSEILKLNVSNAILSIVVGKDDEIYVFFEDDIGKNIKVVKVLNSGLIDMNFGINGIVQIDNYRLDFGNEPIYDRVENAIQIFLYNSLESKSKLFGMNTNGQFIPNYEVNDGLFFLSSIYEFKAFGNQTYYAINYFPNGDNTFQLIKFKKNPLLSNRDVVKTDWSINYRVLENELQIENDVHNIKSVQIYNLMGQELSKVNSLESNSVIRIKFESSSHQLNLVRVLNDKGRTHCFKIMN
ncbi:MAG: hypothetical protein ABIO44_01460 [Saprospiraceae bacterium]